MTAVKKKKKNCAGELMRLISLTNCVETPAAHGSLDAAQIYLHRLPTHYYCMSSVSNRVSFSPRT